jgi:hypothetical protein
MDETVITDLKQFIATTVSQQSTVLRNELRDEMQELHDISMAKIDTLSEAIAEVIESNNEILDVQFSDHEQRITKLEQKAV